jgi:hypothetical protein
MKIKMVLSIILSVVMLHCAYGQTSEQDTFYRSVGIDATFINNFLPLDNPIGSPGNYLFHYIKYNQNGKFTKQALDVFLTGTFQNNESEIDQKDLRLNVNYKIGKGKRKKVLKNGYVLYGTELLVDYFLNNKSIIDPTDPEEESFNKNLDQRWAVSPGPVVGFGYNITRRISLYTEAGFYLSFAYAIDDFKSEFRPTTNFKDKTFSVNTRFSLPSSIILFYHF